MRTAILLQPPVTSSDDLPSCFADRVDEDAVREWLAHPAARRRLVAVPGATRFDDAVSTAVGVDTGSDGGVAVVYLAAASVVADADFDALGLNDAFDKSRSSVDQKVAGMIETAHEQFDAGAWDDARASYLEAEARLANESSDRHAEVLVALGEIERLQGRTREAQALLDRALSIAPRHADALRARAAIARTTGENAIVAAMLQRLLETITDPEERSDVLSTIATESLEAARKAVLGALEQRPNDLQLLHRRRTIAELNENWEDAVTVEVQLAEHLAKPAQRALAFVKAANLCRNRTGNLQRAVALYEAAIEEDPRVAGAFEAIESALVEAEDHEGVARAYRRQLERLGDEDEDARIAILAKLAVVNRERLQDTHATIEVLDEICAIDPGHIDARVELAELLDWVDERTLAIRSLEVAAEHAPFRAGTYRDLMKLFSKSDDDERAYGCAAALVTLGEADIDEQLVYSQFAPEEPLRVERAFDGETWNLLRPEHHDEDVDRLLEAIEPAAVAAFLDARAEAGERIAPDESLRQDPDTTTVAAVRSFGWAARLLGVEVPALYAQPGNTKVAAATFPSRDHAVLLGRQVLIGRSPLELAFLAAHHMTYSRPGWRTIAFFPRPDDLTAVARSAVSIVRPNLIDPDTLDESAQHLRGHLRRHLDGGAQHTLADAIVRMEKKGGRLDLERWMESVELTACRAALLATGDVAVATPMLAVTPSPVPSMTARQRARDLLPFSISQRYTGLRSMVGVSVPLSRQK